MTINKLKERLQTLELEQRKGGNGAATVDWETRYREQIDLQSTLEKQIRSLEKQTVV